MQPYALRSQPCTCVCGRVCVCVCVGVCVCACVCVCLQGNNATSVGGGVSIQAVGDVQTPLHATRAHTISNCTFINNTAGQVRSPCPFIHTHIQTQHRHTHTHTHTDILAHVRSRPLTTSAYSGHVLCLCACLIVLCATYMLLVFVGGRWLGSTHIPLQHDRYGV